MKLERIHEYVLSVTMTLIGIGLALYLGQKSGEGQMKPIFVVLGLGVFMTICLMWRTNTWVLIPAFWPLTGQFVALEVPFNSREIIVLMVFVMFLAFKAVKLVRMKPKFELIDVLLFVNLAYLITVFGRNPVGMDAFGSDRVGGRPYFAVVVGVLAYAVLVRVTMTPGQARRMPLYMIAGNAVVAMMGFITYHFPSTVPFLGKFYSGIDASAYNAEQDLSRVETPTTGREQLLGPLGEDIILAQCSYYRPPTLLNPIYIFRFAFFCLGVYALLKSGHRSMLVGAILVFVLATYIRKWAVDMIKIVLIGVPLVALLVGLQGIAYNLPIPAQRALSFLPGNWDQQAVQDATGSTEWRVEMWRAALLTDKYIKNKMLGDGFGFTREQFAEMTRDTNSEWAAQESAMIAGAFHSGPISSIRYVGVVGMALYYVLMIYMALYAWRLIRACEGTPFYAIALFVGLQLIIRPFSYTFIFGGYDMALPDACFSIGMLKLTRHSLDVYKEAIEPTKPAAVRTMTRSRRPERRPELVPAGLAIR